MTTLSALSKYLIFACILTCTVFAKPKTVIYWGQESDGKEQPLRHYCDSGNYDLIVMGFAYEFPTTSGSDYPALNFASHCETPHDAANPQLLICPGIAADITYCQSIGVQISLSFGGGVGRYGFSSDAEAVTFATLVWNMFMEGSHPIRPFGTAVIDGIDLDIEGGGTTGYIAFINTLRSYFATSQRTYVISSAPQCPYPDGRLGPGAGTALGGAWMDYVFVQFYNNYCGLEFMPYLTTPQFNFDVWAKWARTGSVNPNVQVFLGAPAAARAVGAGFVEAPKLQAYAASVMASYPDVYGGIMLWDASNSDNNNDFGAVVSAIVKAQAGVIPVIQSSPIDTDQVAHTASAEPSTPISTTPVAQASTIAEVSTPDSVTQPSTTGLIEVAATVPITPIAQASTTAEVSTPDSVPSTPTVLASTTSEAVPSMSVPNTPVVPPVSVSNTPVIQTPTTCTTGHMKCLTSETYSMCDRGMWQAAQSCQVQLTCTPSGNYIYCV